MSARWSARVRQYWRPVRCRPESAPTWAGGDGSVWRCGAPLPPRPIDGAVVVSALKIPAPHEHHTAKVAGVVVDLGKGGYASFGTVGYTGVQFDALSVDSSD